MRKMGTLWISPQNLPKIRMVLIFLPAMSSVNITFLCCTGIISSYILITVPFTLRSDDPHFIDQEIKSIKDVSEKGLEISKLYSSKVQLQVHIVKMEMSTGCLDYRKLALVLASFSYYFLKILLL